MIKTFLILIVIGLAQEDHAQKFEYSILAIPDSMRKNASVVLREEYIKLSVKNSSSAKYEVHDVLTVLNEQGAEYLSFNQYSDKFHALDDAEIIVYDIFGNKIKTYFQKSLNTINYGDGLVPEGKYTYFNINAPSYPLTVEINFTLKFKGILGLPGFIFQPALQSVQHAVFEVEAPAEQGIRYKLLNTERRPVKTIEGDKELYRWEINNLTAYLPEKHCGSSSNYVPSVFIGPVKFRLDDYEGDMTSWKNFGTWFKELYAKRTELSEEKKNFYRELVRGASGDQEKAAIIYRYMQHNMRYVSIQLGIGGFRPFPASFVDEKKYGDCKALSNFLKAALDAVGIKSNVLIIEGGMHPRKVYPDFSADYFNHVILSIPGLKDTTWLECTSTSLPFGELGPFTENRAAMMVTDSGGVLVNTPQSNFKNNLENCYTQIAVDKEGGAKVTAVYSTSGFGRDELLMRFHDMKEDDKRTFFIGEKGWKQPDILHISNSDNLQNPYRVTANMEYEKISSFSSGGKYFLEPRLYPIYKEEAAENPFRKHDYYFTYPYQVSDTTVYQFPQGFVVESLPQNKLLSRPFGAYNCNYKWDSNAHSLRVVTLLQIKEMVVKAADYKDLLDFNKQVILNMNEKIVMKKEGEK